MSDPQSKPQPTQGELIGSFIKLAHEFAGHAEESRFIAEKYIRVAQQETRSITDKDADPLELALQTLSDTGQGIKMFKDSLDGMEKASRITGTEQHKEQPPELQHPTPARRKTVQLGISKAIQSSYLLGRRTIP